MEYKIQSALIILFVALKPCSGQICSWNSEGLNLPCCNLSEQIYIFSEPPECNNSPWILKFEDNFDNENLNSLYWYDRLPWGDYLPPEAIYLPDNIVVNNGYLNLLMKPENDWFCVPYFFQPSPNCYPPECCNYCFYNYSGAAIWSKKEFKYGKFEMRCKIPSGNGFWPAFWLFSGNPWNEIDIFEFNNHSTTNHIMTFHYDLDGNALTDGYNEQCRGDYIGPDFSSDFFTFSLIWDEYKIEWYVNDTLVRRVTKYHAINTQSGMVTAVIDCNDIIPYQQYLIEEHTFPDNPMSVIISTSPQSGTYSPDNFTIFPTAMEVDYIRIWQKEPHCCVSHKLYEATNDLPVLTSVDNYIKAGFDSGIDDISGDVVVQSGQGVTFRAGDFIELSGGFTVEAGANFLAEIGPCSSNQGEDIEIISFPDSFSPDNDGIDDKLFISVNGATSYKLRIQDKDPPFNTFYKTDNKPIFSNPVVIWDGSCNYIGNCWFYHLCNRQREVILSLYNCEKNLISQKIIAVNCNTKSLEIEEDFSIHHNDENVSRADSVCEIPQFSAHPNPFNDSFTLTITQTEDSEIKIYLTNTFGRKVLQIYSGQLEMGQHTIEASAAELPPGMYFCILETQSQRKVLKVVKTNKTHY